MVELSNTPNITDWITALASVGAMIGTVGAVIFGLWQVRRQDKTRTRVSTQFRSRNGRGFVSAWVVHQGGPPLTIKTIYARVDVGRLHPPTLGASTVPPAVLRHGDTAEVHWPAEAFPERRQGQSVVMELFTIVFEDTLGRRHTTLSPHTLELRDWPLSGRLPWRIQKRFARRVGWTLSYDGDPEEDQ